MYHCVLGTAPDKHYRGRSDVPHYRVPCIDQLFLSLSLSFFLLTCVLYALVNGLLSSLYTTREINAFFFFPEDRRVPISRHTRREALARSYSWIGFV